jgi:hypothetical protein
VKRPPADDPGNETSERNTDRDSPAVISLVRELCEAMAAWPEVNAIALGGSRATGLASANSDIDLYVYARQAPPVARRRELFFPRAAHLEVDNRFWENGDEWIDRETGVVVDLMYRAPEWIEAALARALDEHQCSVGYSTCLWHNIRTAKILFDRNGWFADLQAKAQQPYPAQLAQAIIAKNYPLLRGANSSFPMQILRAADREDVVSVNHRIAAFFASYFDVLFALNGMPHPGEKRLVEHASQLLLAPDSLCHDVNLILRAATSRKRKTLLLLLDKLVDDLEPLLSRSALHSNHQNDEHED